MTVTRRGCSQDLKEPPRASPIAFEPGHGAGGRRWRASLAGVAGGRRWRASLAGVAGGRRRRSRTKIDVFSIKGTETPHTHKPKNKQRTPSCGGLRVTPRPNTAEKTPPIDLDRASQIEIERPNETREQRRNSAKGPCQKIRTNTAADRPIDAKKFVGDTQNPVSSGNPSPDTQPGRGVTPLRGCIDPVHN